MPSLRVGEVVHEPAGLRVDLAPEVQQVGGPVRRRVEQFPRVVLVDQGAGRAEVLQAVDGRAQVVQVGVLGVNTEVLGLAFARLGEPIVRPGQHRVVEQLVVLAEPGVDAGQQPAGGDLGELLAAPGLERQSGA